MKQRALVVDSTGEVLEVYVVTKNSKHPDYEIALEGFVNGKYRFFLKREKDIVFVN